VLGGDRLAHGLGFGELLGCRTLPRGDGRLRRGELRVALVELLDPPCRLLLELDRVDLGRKRPGASTPFCFRSSCARRPVPNPFSVDPDIRG
jgi:hypothetical protein